MCRFRSAIGRIYFGQIATDWRAENTVGLRMVHSDGGGGAVDGTALQDRRLTWLGVYAENGFYEIQGSDRALSYASAVTYLAGAQQLAASTSQKIGAWQANADLRWRPIRRVPLYVGGGYTWSQGGERNGRSHQFQQTGMQSNSSYFTGTGTLIGRYNETLQAQLGNLRVAMACVSLDLDRDDISVVFTRFRRDDGLAPIVTNAVTATPVNDSRDIGVGVDFVLTHHFAREQRRQRLLDRGDAFTRSTPQLAGLAARIALPAR